MVACLTTHRSRRSSSYVKMMVIFVKIISVFILSVYDACWVSAFVITKICLFINETISFLIWKKLAEVELEQTSQRGLFLSVGQVGGVVLVHLAFDTRPQYDDWLLFTPQLPENLIIYWVSCSA